jgi:hypothetical protein
MNKLIQKVRNTEHRPGQQPLQRPNARASDGEVRRMTGQSGPAHPANMHHVHYHQHGDHRQEGLHSGPENSSKPPPVMAGKPFQRPPNAGGGNGNNT